MLGAGNQPRAAPGPSRPGAAGSSQGQPAAASGDADPGPRKEKRPLPSQECEGHVEEAERRPKQARVPGPVLPVDPSKSKLLMENAIDLDELRRKDEGADAIGQ